MKNSLLTTQSFTKNSLQLEVNREIDRLVQFLRDSVTSKLNRRGAVVGISGGIDSSVAVALCVKAFGANKVLGVMLPEDESSPDSERLAHDLSNQYGFSTVSENISAALAGAGCYRRRDEAIKRVIPEFGTGWRSKITLPGSLLDDETLNFFYLTAVSPEGEEVRKRLPNSEFFQIVAASNFKQRARMAMLYYHAELRNYAVIGTANKNEHDLGFFVKYGDGGVDVNPIVHLFKSQIYQLAKQLGIPEEIIRRTPTSDTYSAGSTQEEFFFRLPFQLLDLIWFGYEQGVKVEMIAEALELTSDQVERVINDIQRKMRTTNYLRTPAIPVKNHTD